MAGQAECLGRRSLVSLLGAVAIAAMVSAVPSWGARLTPAGAQSARLQAATTAHLYWSEPETSRGPAGHGIDNIWRANLNGSSVDRNFVGGLAIPGPVAVGGQYLYWGASEGGTLGRARLDGTHVNRSLIQATADALAVGSYIYWSVGSSPGRPAAIWRASLNGSRPHKLFSIGKGTYIGGLAVDRYHLFWTNQDTGRIGRANLNGSGVKLRFITGLTDPTGLALDSQHLFWASGPPGSGNSIGRAGIGGSHVMTEFITGANEPFGVAVGAGHIYWANTGSGTIGRARRDGTHVEQSFIRARVLYQGYDAADPFGLAVGP